MTKVIALIVKNFVAPKAAAKLLVNKLLFINKQASKIAQTLDQGPVL